MPGENQSTDSCLWLLYDADRRVWESSCGESFILNDGTPSQNRMRFCCYCGRSVKEISHAR